MKALHEAIITPLIRVGAVGCMQIVVRVRPVLPHEVSQPVAVTCSKDASSVQIALPEREFSKPAIAASSKPDAKAYEFDACLKGSTTQVCSYVPPRACSR